jgi:hypothetical protein
VQFVGINVKDNDAAAKGFVRTYGITYPSMVDDEGRLLLMLRGSLPEAIPSTLVIDRQGRIAARALGGITEQQLAPPRGGGTGRVSPGYAVTGGKVTGQRSPAAAAKAG